MQKSQRESCRNTIIDRHQGGRKKGGSEKAWRVMVDSRREDNVGLLEAKYRLIELVTRYKGRKRRAKVVGSRTIKQVIKWKAFINRSGGRNRGTRNSCTARSHRIWEDTHPLQSIDIDVRASNETQYSKGTPKAWKKGVRRKPYRRLARGDRERTNCLTKMCSRFIF